MVKHHRVLSLLVALVSGCGDGGTTETPTAPATPVATSVAITPPSVTLAALGETVQLSVAVLDQNAQPMAGTSVIWASSDGSVATVDAGGVVTAVWNGNTSVTAAVPGGVSGAAAVTVAQQVREISLATTAGLLQALGETMHLSPEGFDSNGNLVVDADFGYSSSDESVVTVDSTGLVTAVGNGSASVSASSGPATADADFVVEQRAAELQLSPDAPVLTALGDTLRMVFAAVDANGHPVESVEQDITWSSSDESVATVDAGGLLMAVANGSAMITGVSGAGAVLSTIVTVEQQAAGMQVSPAPETFRAFADTARLSATVVDANGHVVESAEYAWSSGDESIVTVDAAGLVTSVGNGNTVVSAAAGGLSASVAVTVSQEIVAVRVTSPTDKVSQLGGTLQMSAEAVDANDYLVSGTRFAWTSDDESVATVDAVGLVTAIGLGYVGITAEAIGTSLSGIAVLAIAVNARDLLVAIYNATGGPGWRYRTNWLSDAPINTWHGVSTDSAGRVTHLSVVAGMTGALPRELGYLRHLRFLEIWNAKLTEPIPPWIGGLDSLRILTIFNSELRGPLPAELGNLTKLEQLNLSWNEVTGPIPRELGHLEDLSELALDQNELSGAIPRELGNLASLSTLNLSGNNLSAPIPSEFANLANLEELVLYWNDLTGPLPSGLGGLPKLRRIDVSGNNLTGPVPSGLANLANLEELDLSTNSWTGQIPSWLGTMTSLKRLELGDGLTGRIPAELGSLANLEVLSLSGNDLTGGIPVELANLAKLEVLDLSGDGLTGPIPVELGNLRNLRDLWLRGNNLTGLIPVQLGNLANLQRLLLNGNGLAGPIPTELGNLANLTALNLGGNDFGGPIPSALGNLRQLTHLDIANANLSGPIPPELANLRKLQQLYLYKNDLTGPIPQFFINFRLQYFNWRETSLCAPANEAFQRWLRGIQGHVGGATCSGSG